MLEAHNSTLASQAGPACRTNVAVMCHCVGSSGLNMSASVAHMQATPFVKAHHAGLAQRHPHPFQD